MSKSKANFKSKQSSNIEALSKKMYLEMSKAERKSLKNYYTNFIPAFTLNPFAIAYYQGNFNNYILFIDARINSCYIRVKGFLEKNKNKISSYSCVGDADFIVEYSATEGVHMRFKKEIYQLLETAPKENPCDKLVESFKISKTFIYKGTQNNYSEKSDYNLTEEEIRKIAQIQGDYSKKTNIDLFDNERNLKIFLHDIRDRQILLGYYSLGESNKPSIKAYILLLYTKIGYEHFILRNIQIRDKLFDFYSIKIDSGDDEFYQQANYLITAEFASISEYHKWKEDLYILSNKSEHQINVMTFIIENTISQIPKGIGNYMLFDEISKKYNAGINDKIILGHPYYFQELKDQYNICVNLGTLKENGLILGESGSGKTYTSMIFSKKLFEKKKRVHILDCSGGISDKFLEVYPTYQTEMIKKIDISQFEKTNFILEKTNNIFFYQPEKRDYCNFTVKLLEYIINIPNPDESRTTNDIVIFEEAHLLFGDEIASKTILECITISGRKGYSLWFSTQKLSNFPSTLLSNLRNKIIHKIDNTEKKSVANLLLNSGEENMFEDIEKELISLERGQAIVSFVFPHNNLEIELSPIKIKVLADK